MRAPIIREIRERSLHVAGELGNTPVAEIIAIKGEDYISESLNELGEALGVFLQVARAEIDPEKRVGYYQNVVAVAYTFAQYRYSRLALIHNSGSDKEGRARTRWRRRARGVRRVYGGDDSWHQGER